MARLKVVQQCLRPGGGVLEEAKDCDEHLDDLQGGDVGALGAPLHVLNTHRDTGLGRGSQMSNDRLFKSETCQKSRGCLWVTSSRGFNRLSMC